MTQDLRPLIGDLTPAQVADHLELIGDADAAGRIRHAGASGQVFGRVFGRETYLATGVLVGFVEHGSEATSAIVGGHQVTPEEDLRDTPLKITLEQFFVQRYPGLGRHRVLVDFSGQNQAAADSEEIKFALTLEAADGSAAGVHGKPIFTGVRVGTDGLNFRGQTTNVRSTDDDLVLDALGSDAFRQGLSLLTTAQPVLKPFVGLATGALKAIYRRSRNCPVFRFDLGLDFSERTQATRLRCGSYVIVQHDEHTWDWANFRFDRGTRTVLRGDGQGPLALNYLVIGVERFAGTPKTDGRPGRDTSRKASLTGSNRGHGTRTRT